MSSVKLIAFFLPQFHQIPENDLWWGEGYTEWTNLKAFKPIYKSHKIKRPRKDIGYYNLLERDVRKRQAEMAKDNGIHGFCYYHYWSNGSQLLQKPLELMLEDGEPDIPFMFSWANHNWLNKFYGESSDILWEQKYSDQAEWEAHYRYLSNFFKHKNYIKIDNKPVFAIYMIAQMDNSFERLSYYDKLAKEDGFDGIYIVSTLGGGCFPENQSVPSHLESVVSASIEFEPMFTWTNLRDVEFAIKYILMGKKPVVDTGHFLRKIEKCSFDRKVFRGTFAGWDNTPRMKKGEKALIFTDPSKMKFQNHLSRLMKISEKEKSEFIFINAWNEWGEGAALEPNHINSDDYLKSIKKLTQ